ncbi:hypothetical protein DYB30_006740 [Aphanomyces astaci]|uniref:FAR-17a/AIG1-like protein n=1 Tax=Aphanomyces astaci TaxID=112090 RepID=A0A397E0Y1_APHAT|nr:hypothetical protein DYB30_006740 [Aphanomyces astaci]
MYRIVAYPVEPGPHNVQIAFNPSNVWLLSFRCATFVFFVVVWILQVQSSNWFELVYYTYWNFTLQTIYFGAAIVDQMRRWSRPPTLTDRYYANRPLNTLFDVVFASLILVALVYWIFIFNTAKHIEWPTYVVHLVNVVLVVVEFAFNEHLAQRTSLKYVVLWPAIFASVAWIGHATYTRGFWPYNIMSLDNPYAPLVWLGIGVAHVVCFGFVLLLSYFKARWVGGEQPPRLLAPQDMHLHA